jgi:hypothetical protein
MATTGITKALLDSNNGAPLQVVGDALDRVLENTPVGPVSTAIGQTVYGLNHRQQPNAVPMNKDYFGMTFFTRPRMNMSTANLRQVRQFAPLLTTNPNSLQRVIRCMLDTESGKRNVDQYSSALVDDQQAFIPILTNQLVSMGGWPDMELPHWTSKPGVYQENYSMADGNAFVFRAFELQCNFRNIPGDPITTLMLSWVLYAALVFEGILMPYPEMIVENEIDYQTRIYRLVLDSNRRYVQKIAATGAAYPILAPIGSAFNFESDTPINRSSDQVSVSFHCMGALYQDDILIKEFNQTVVNQNYHMNDKFRAQYMKQIPPGTTQLFNHSGYPRINPATYELEWWILIEDYNSVFADGGDIESPSDQSDIL